MKTKPIISPTRNIRVCCIGMEFLVTEIECAVLYDDMAVLRLASGCEGGHKCLFIYCPYCGHRVQKRDGALTIKTKCNHQLEKKILSNGLTICCKQFKDAVDSHEIVEDGGKSCMLLLRNYCGVSGYPFKYCPFCAHKQNWEVKP